MKPASSRTFTIFDATILVAATAVGMSLIRATLGNDRQLVQNQRGLVVALGLGTQWPTLLLTTWTLAFLVIAWRRPRPRWRVWARRPGNVACVVATLAILYSNTRLPILILRIGESYPDLFPGYLPFPHPGGLETAVASWITGAWLTLILGGCWRRARSWVEWLGRALGILWLLNWCNPAIYIAVYIAGCIALFPRFLGRATVAAVKTVSVRKFTLFDALILIAATALGFAAIRVFFIPGSGAEFALSYQWLSWNFILAAMISDVMTLMGPFLKAWTFAFLVLRLRQPRPRLRTLAAQPGMAACSAAALVLVVTTIPFPPAPFGPLPILRMLRGPVRAPFWAVESGGGVIGAWLALALAGRWRPESSWIDRLGRTLGVALIVLNVIHHGFAMLINL